MARASVDRISARMAAQVGRVARGLPSIDFVDWFTMGEPAPMKMLAERDWEGIEIAADQVLYIAPTGRPL